MMLSLLSLSQAQHQHAAKEQRCQRHSASLGRTTLPQGRRIAAADPDFGSALFASSVRLSNGRTPSMQLEGEQIQDRSIRLLQRSTTTPIFQRRSFAIATEVAPRGCHRREVSCQCFWSFSSHRLTMSTFGLPYPVLFVPPSSSPQPRTPALLDATLPPSLCALLSYSGFNDCDSTINSASEPCCPFHSLAPPSSIAATTPLPLRRRTASSCKPLLCQSESQQEALHCHPGCL